MLVKSFAKIAKSFQYEITYEITMDNKDLIICSFCDSIYKRKKNLRANEAIYCRVCGNKLQGQSNFFEAFIYAITAIILFLIANIFPFITLSLKGELNTISVFSGVKALFDNDLIILAILVFLFIIIIPLYYLIAVLWVIISFKLKFLNNFSRKFLFLLHLMSPWNMLEVYLAGVITTLVKIMSMASVSFNQGFWAFVALMIFSILVNSKFDVNDAIFHSYEDQQ